LLVTIIKQHDRYLLGLSYVSGTVISGLYKLGNLTFCFVLAKQAFYCLSHTSSPFCSGYFEDGVLSNYLSGLALNQDPPNFSIPST
jgi:hypothetical protein